MKRVLIALNISGAMLAYALPATAQVTTDAPAPAPGSASPPAVQREGELGEIVVTAQRRSERLRDVPISLTAVTGEDLSRSNITSTKELTAAVPGLAFTTQGAWAQPNIRGVSTFNSGVGAESPIAIYVDGVYYTNQVGSVFDMPDVERLEVLKGPQGTLFGRNATGGAISIHTRDPELGVATGKFTVEDGIYFGDDVKTSNEITVKGFASVPLGEKFAASLTGIYRHNQGYLINDRLGGRVGRQEAYTIRGKLLFEASDTARFVLAGFYGRDHDNTNSSLQPLRGVTAANGQVRTNPADPTSALAYVYDDRIVPTEPRHIAGEIGRGGARILTKSEGVNLTATFDLPDIGSLTSLTSYLKVAAYPNVDVDGSYSPDCLAAFACNNYFVISGPNTSYQQELTFASDDFGPFRFILGAFYYHDKGISGANLNYPLGPNGEPMTDINGVFYNSGVIKTEAYAGFGELYFDVSDSLHLIGGVRYSHEKKRASNSILGADQPPTQDSWSSWTPRFSVRYDLSSQANVYATFSKGFKSGVLNASAVIGSALPETLTSYEVGTKIGTPTFNLSAAAFYYDYKDLQIQFFNGVQSILGNAANAEIYGFEVDSSIKLVEGLQLRLAGSWIPHAKYTDFPGGIDYVFYPQPGDPNYATDNPNGYGPIGPGGLRQVIVDASGQRILKTPKFTGNATLSYTGEIGMGTLDATAVLYYSGGYSWNLTDRVRTKSYVTLGGTLGLTPSNSNFRFYIFGKNLTNATYISGAVLSAAADNVLYNPPRQVGLGVDFKF